MTTSASPPAQVQLHLLSFDAAAKVVADWLGIWLSKWQNEAELWLLLEQMHCFDFEGPDVSKIQPLITVDSVGTYGLRGRLFWASGQIEWRRLSPDHLRVVVMIEGSMAIAAPEGIEAVSEAHLMEPGDSRFILWGTSRDGGEFRELRVGGSTPVPYPALLKQAVAGRKGTYYPILPFRTYADKEGREQVLRFLPPMVAEEKNLY